MTAVPPVAPVAGTRSLVDRVKEILLQPKSEWPVIDAEPATVGSIYRYVLILAAIGPVCTVIGLSVFGMRIPLMGTIRVPISYVAKTVIFQYVGALIGVYVVALIVDALAPSFGGHKNQIQALKVTAYSWTAAWIGGVVGLFPGSLAFVGLIVALYSLYLLYLGLPVLMKAPADKAMGYTVVSILAAIVVFVLIGVLSTRLAPMPFDPGSMTLPGN